MIEPLLVTEAVKWLTGNILGIGVSTTVIVLVLVAIEGRKVVKAGSVVSTWFRIGLVTIGAIGLLLGVGVLTGVNVDRAIDLVSMVWDALAGFL